MKTYSPTPGCSHKFSIVVSQVRDAATSVVFFRLAYGTDTGAVIVDMAHKVCLLNIATPDLYGGADPYQRVPKSPKRTQPPDSDPDRCRSPSIDQVSLEVRTALVPSIFDLISTNVTFFILKMCA